MRRFTWIIWVRGPQPLGLGQLMLTGCTAGGEQGASELSFTCDPPSLTLWPKPSPAPHPATPFVEKLSSTKPVPGAKNVGDR